MIWHKFVLSRNVSTLHVLIIFSGCSATALSFSFQCGEKGFLQGFQPYILAAGYLLLHSFPLSFSGSFPGTWLQLRLQVQS